MKHEYRKSYGKLYEEFSQADESSTVVAKVIDEAEKQVLFQVGLRLREDAKYLLLLNLRGMIAHPLLMGGIVLDSILEAAQGDVRLLISAAASRVKEAGETEVSGHAVIDAISAIWPDLKLTHFQLWG